MMINNTVFFAIWLLFMKATGPINGWTSLDVFGMLGISMFIFGITHGFFYGFIDLPQFVVKGNFDSVLLSPISSFFKTAGMSFSITAYGDLFLGFGVTIVYAVLKKFDVHTAFLYICGIILGAIVFLCIRVLCSLIVFFIHDGETIARQLFEIFLRPGLYPGAIFPNKLKIFFMTVIPALLTSAIPIDIIKDRSLPLMLTSFCITGIWVLITYLVFRSSVKRYESGNYLR